MTRIIGETGRAGMPHGSKIGLNTHNRINIQ